MQSALVALGATIAAAVPSLEVRGTQFVNPSNGNAFQIAGMAYQPGGSAGFDPSHGRDPLSDKDVCMRDAALLQRLGMNTIRVYNLDPDLNHDDCSTIFNSVSAAPVSLGCWPAYKRKLMHLAVVGWHLYAS